MIYSTTFVYQNHQGSKTLRTYAGVTGTCLDLITSAETVWDCPQQVPISLWFCEIFCVTTHHVKLLCDKLKVSLFYSL